MKKRGFFVFGLAVGFLIGNSITSVSVIAVSSLLGFMGSVVSMIIIVVKEKENDKKTSNNMDNLDTLGSIFGLFFMGMIIGNIFGAIFKKGIPVGSHIIQFDTSTQIPKQTSP